jgi:putative transposase
VADLRVHAAGDNAAMESFFALLQNNVLNRCAWSTPRTPDRDRRLDRARLPPPTPNRLGRLSPIEYEAIMATPASQAA